MKYIDLNSITTDHVLGKWEVIDRVVNTASQGSMFSDIKIIELRPDSYTSINGKKLTGEWEVSRNSSVIYNPQLRFFIDDTEVGKAIITRLLHEIDEDDKKSKLTLYFNTGIELIMTKHISKD